MGLTAVLKQEHGAELALFADDHNVLHRILPEAGDKRFPYLSCVDWYGDTLFNKLQAPQLIEELGSLGRDSNDPESRRVVDAILELAMKLEDGTHLHLEFVGD